MSCPFSKNNILSVIVFALIALALGIGLNTWIAARHKLNLPISGTRVVQPQRVPEFHLTDGLGTPFTNHSLKGHYNFLFFGYTHCQGICPMTMTMTMLTQLYAQLKKDNLPLPQIVFITLDPKRDTQKVVANYVKAFNSNFKGVTGPLVGIQQLSKQMGVVYIKAQQSKDKNYQIDHSGTLYLVNPSGQLLAVFSPPHEKDTIAKDYKALNKLKSTIPSKIA